MVDRAPGNETLPPPKEISVTRFGRHEPSSHTLQQTRIFRPSRRVTKHSPLLLLLHSSIALASRIRYGCTEIRGWLFAFPTEIRRPPSSIFRSLSRSRFFRHTFSLLPRYLIFIGGIFQRYFFSAPGNIALLCVYIYIYVCRYLYTLKNIKLGIANSNTILIQI